MDEMQTHGGHTLPTIPHFHQRPELDRLREVWRDEPWQRLIVLSAPPGSGKTALLSRFLEELPGSGVNRAGIEKRNDLPAPRGVFVWSVHLDRDVDQFLVRFHDYLVGEALPSNRRYAATSRLIQALEAERITPTLLVLDGVEILHESWEPWWITAHSDHRLCHILRRAAVGTIGLRVLLTSTGWSSGQFGLTYDDYVLLGGTRALRLDEELGCSILRDRGLRGSDDQLPDLVERLLPAQALELDHLGMLASGFHDGTLDRFSEESRHRLLDIADREGRTIIGAMYQHHMPPQELALLQILSAFRHPLRATMMEDFLSATLEEVEKQLALPSDRPRKGARDAESLAACARSYESIKCSLPDLLVALRERNLVEVYTDEGQIYYGPHPVVRHDAYQSLGSDAVTLHQQIANYVDYRPPPWVLAEELAPNDVEALHRMEASFHHGLRSPHGSLATAAFSSHRLGRSAYELLGWRPAAYERGARLLAPALTRETSVRRRDLDFQPAQRFIFGHGSYFHDLSLFLMDLGRTREAESISRRVARQSRPKHYHPLGTPYACLAAHDLIDVFLLLGALPEAEARASELAHDVESAPPPRGSSTGVQGILAAYARIGMWANPYARRALARGLQGQTRQALRDYELADDLELRLLDSDRFEARGFSGRDATDYAGFLLRLGLLDAAETALRRAEGQLLKPDYPALTMLLHLALSDLFRLRGDHRGAREQVQEPLTFGLGTGHQEIYCRARLAQARLELSEGRPDRAVQTATEAQRVARECDFGIYHIDSLVTCGRTAMLRNDREAALEMTHTAVRLAREPACAYAWGEGNALHLLGDILLREGHPDRAREYLQQAVRLRARIEDPRRANTQRLLNGLSKAE